jgi:hypothetical protein
MATRFEQIYINIHCGINFITNGYSVILTHLEMGSNFRITYLVHDYEMLNR